MKSDAIGRLTHFRLEMDEDFMADSEAPVFLAQPGEFRLRRPGRFRRPPFEPDLDPDRRSRARFSAR